MMTSIKTETEIAAHRRAGRALGAIFNEIIPRLEPGIATKTIDEWARSACRDHGVRPSFLGYQPRPGGPAFPAAICVSVNEEIVHGVPGRHILAEGDIVGLDFGVSSDGYHVDAAVTVPIGTVSEDAQRLITTTEEALRRAIGVVKDGVHVGDIGAVVEQIVQGAGYSVVRELAGHGIGREVHEDPFILNYGTKGMGAVLREGMTVAIEPMVITGRPEITLGADGWTISSKDGSLTAHFEHTILVTKTGAEILTERTP